MEILIGIVMGLLLVFIGLLVDRWRMRALIADLNIRLAEAYRLIETQRYSHASPLDHAGSISLPRNGSHFYVGEGKPVFSQQPDWPPNVGDIRDDPRRKM